MSNYIDELMDITPEVSNMFAEPTKQSTANPLIYKTNPSLANKDVSPDGYYRSKIRVLYNPFNYGKSIVSRQTYKFDDADGWFNIDSVLTNGDKNCPFFKAWKALHFDKNPEIVINYDGKDMTRQQWGDAIFNKEETRWVMVQIIEDENQPELVGQIKAMKLPKHIYDIIVAKMNPTDKAKAPVDLMNYLFGPILAMEVQPGPDDPQKPERKNREISYSLCSFEETEPTPITNLDGSPLFEESEIEAITDYFNAKRVLTSAKSTAKKKEEAKKQCEGLISTLKPLMEKALNFMKEHAFDLEKEFGYKAPSEELMARGMKWLSVVNAFKDPQIYIESATTYAAPAASAQTLGTDLNMTSQEVMPGDDDLPF